MWIFAVVPLACAVVVFGVLWFRSPGLPVSSTGSDGRARPPAVAEKVFVTINGARQGMFITGADDAHPVLLYLHGGMPGYFLNIRYPSSLEERFTVVWWEQRGAGLSYEPGAPAGAVTTEQLISDTLEVTHYLRHRFGRDKIYLMGHSGGTFIGLQVVARAPQFYHAYIGVAQMVRQLRSEVRAYAYMVETFRSRGDASMVRRLEAAPVSEDTGVPAAYLSVRDQAMHALGVGTTHRMRSVLTGIFLASWLCPAYTLREKWRLWRGKLTAGVSVLWQEMLRTDLASLVPDVRVPVYLLHGVYDYTCSYPEARAYFDRLQAPVKGFYTFAHAAHSPIFEEPERVGRIMQDDVLTGRTTLADPETP
jgi:pimeloyl-ACP methyl ester carboxylesterase